MAPRKTNMVVARERILINVGGEPAVYRKIMVTDRRTGNRVEILDTDNPPVQEEDPGTPYVFRAGEKVSRSHPAVQQNPAAFMSLDEAAEVFDDVFEPAA